MAKKKTTPLQPSDEAAADMMAAADEMFDPVEIAPDAPVDLDDGEDVALDAPDPEDPAPVPHDLAAENARLRALLAKAGMAADPRPETPEEREARRIKEWPTIKYRARPVSDRHPNGYETKRVQDEDEAKRLGPEWVDSPADLPQV